MIFFTVPLEDSGTSCEGAPLISSLMAFVVHRLQRSFLCRCLTPPFSVQNDRVEWASCSPSFLRRWGFVVAQAPRGGFESSLRPARRSRDHRVQAFVEVFAAFPEHQVRFLGARWRCALIPPIASTATSANPTILSRLIPAPPFGNALSVEPVYPFVASRVEGLPASATARSWRAEWRARRGSSDRRAAGPARSRACAAGASAHSCLSLPNSRSTAARRGRGPSTHGLTRDEGMEAVCLDPHRRGFALAGRAAPLGRLALVVGSGERHSPCAQHGGLCSPRLTAGCLPQRDDGATPCSTH